MPIPQPNHKHPDQAHGQTYPEPRPLPAFLHRGEMTSCCFHDVRESTWTLWPKRVEWKVGDEPGDCGAEGGVGGYQ